MNNLKKIVEAMDAKNQEVVRKALDLEFKAYPTVNWEKIQVYKDYEKLTSKILYKLQTWYFGAAASAIVASGESPKIIKFAILDMDKDTPQVYWADRQKGKKREMLVIIPISVKERKELLK